MFLRGGVFFTSFQFTCCEQAGDLSAEMSQNLTEPTKGSFTSGQTFFFLNVRVCLALTLEHTWKMFRIPCKGSSETTTWSYEQQHRDKPRVPGGWVRFCCVDSSDLFSWLSSCTISSESSALSSGLSNQDICTGFLSSGNGSKTEDTRRNATTQEKPQSCGRNRNRCG